MALLSSVEAADFAALRDTLEVTDGNLNRHLTVLADHDFVEIDKTRNRGQRTRTWVQLTDTGRTALDAHVAALRAVLDGID